MPCFSKRLTEKKQFIVNVFIVDANKYYRDSSKIDFKNSKLYKALVDTGATNTCISEELAKDLDLTPVCKKKIQTAGNPVECNGYDIHIGIPVDEITKYKQVMQEEKSKLIPVEGLTHIKAWKSSVVGLPEQSGGRNYDCLLGMDVLAACSFQYSGGVITICF